MTFEYKVPKRRDKEGQEAFISRMSIEREIQFAFYRGVSVETLRLIQRHCAHKKLIKGHYVDSCEFCDKAIEI